MKRKGERMVLCEKYILPDQYCSFRFQIYHFDYLELLRWLTVKNNNLNKMYLGRCKSMKIK